MKKIMIVLSVILISIMYYSPVNAQNINVNVNIGNQPSWGPSGYDNAEYYYFPDLNIYFDVNSSLFYYLTGSKWVSNQYLPDKYRKYDLYSLYKVVLNDSKPWLQNKTHKKNYSTYKGDKTQTPIRYSTDSRYNENKSKSNAWVKPNNSSNVNNAKDNSNNKKDQNHQASQNNKKSERSKTSNQR